MINNYRVIESIGQLNDLLITRRVLTHYAFQNLDFNQADSQVAQCHFQDCLFLGCIFPSDFYLRTTEACVILQALDVPYNAFRTNLYTVEDLYNNYQIGCPESYQQCFDAQIYRSYMELGANTRHIMEALARSIHDNSINDAMNNFLQKYSPWQVVGVMGGHGLKRTDPMYRNIVLLSKQLTESGSLMVSGGGPGAMEATHLGAWMAGRNSLEVDNALDILCKAPCFKDDGWLDTAFRVRQKYPQDRYESLGIPTWLYGHEPATPLATHIAKYFDNSIRENSIVTVAMGGLVFTPGSAGTLQEIFQDAVQNHYLTNGYASPMIFLGTDFWLHQVPVYPLMQHMVSNGRYQNMILSLTDAATDVINEIAYFREQMKGVQAP